MFPDVVERIQVVQISTHTHSTLAEMLLPQCIFQIRMVKRSSAMMEHCILVCLDGSQGPWGGGEVTQPVMFHLG